MAHQQFASGIEACNTSADECDHCTVACLPLWKRSAPLPPWPLLMLTALMAGLLGAQANAENPEAANHEAMDMAPTESAMDQGGHQGMSHDMMMPSQFGPYAMTREGSGTSWQPDATPHTGLMWEAGDWMLMAHGFANAVYDHQGGPRGDDKAFVNSMAMLMAQRPALGGTMGFRAMVSLDPLMGKDGYPLLFQTGETADGMKPLVDRQHPHDAFMELSVTHSHPVGNKGAVYLYAGLPGEPALGPPAFMHRFSGMRNPEAPLTHHWLDSTHITFGVVTLGASQGPWKLEVSSFNGREPDDSRWNIETRKFDSWSTRLSYNPTPNWAFEISHGDLDSPEALEPDTSIQRHIASAMHHMQWGPGEMQTTLAWGRNDKRSPAGKKKLDGVLLESAYVFKDTHTLFGRYDRVENDELFDSGSPLADRNFTIDKLSLGYIYDFARTGPVAWGVGGLVSGYRKPAALDAVYGDKPRSYMVFLQGRL
ncbi:MAG: hypothetical protein V4729_09040 [Pseudomonadota bacterium]